MTFKEWREQRRIEREQLKGFTRVIKQAGEIAALQEKARAYGYTLVPIRGDRRW